MCKKKILQFLNKLRDAINTFSIVPYKSYPVDNSPWDGPKQRKLADVDDLKIMATYYDPERAEIKGSYKLIHHLAGNKYISRPGTFAAMAALLGARGGVDMPTSEKKGAYNHLKKHYVNDLKIEEERVPKFAG